MKKVVLSVVALMGLVAAATPQVNNVTAKQRYPWNGLVDITCSVTGIEGTTDRLCFEVAALPQGSGTVHAAQHCWVIQEKTKSTDLRVHTNGNYWLLWDAQADLGQVIYSNLVVRVMVFDPDTVQLWEGGPYWATRNIGAEKPEDYGYYFWWGDTVGYKRENDKWVATDGSSSNFSFSSDNAPTYNKNIDTLKSEGWITAAGSLAPAHDAAHVHWGGKWRMPTDAEFSALINNCTTTWTTQNGVYGRLVTGKGAYAGRSIFLPAAGSGDDSGLSLPGSTGHYWSSTPSTSNDAWSPFFYSSTFYLDYYGLRYLGQSVRPVRGFAK